ncbi:MAG: protein-ADP-ribose hydrolase [Oscillospiraceae bacterium]|nr:protein-ADP-ribose hydrolase [Oscillospiraceae bacterium]
MTQEERRRCLLQALISEEPQYRALEIPESAEAQKRLLRALFNLRMPRKTDQTFLDIQDAYLQEETRQKGITDLDSLTPVKDSIYLWRGDITTLRCDAIVNAANSQMLGCFCPNHGCIDNAIHTFSGVQLRQACADLMARQDSEEPMGMAKITGAYNLPCKYVLHTVGPIIYERVTERDCELLASCYRSCLSLAAENQIQSVAFCCISTGEFHFPNALAAQIAVETVTDFLKTHGDMKVVFNAFKDTDMNAYQRLL